MSQCTYPNCKCPFDMGADGLCLMSYPSPPPPKPKRIDIISSNGNTGEHYGTVQIGRFIYKKGPGTYAMYLNVKNGDWRESASVTNAQLEQQGNL